MFAAAEIPQQLDDAAFEELEPALRERLLDAQSALRSAPFAAVIVIDGMEGSGKGDLLHRLLEWLDARGVEVHALREPSDEERERPALWRFWRRLPAAGRIGIFVGGWYSDALAGRAAKKKGARAAFEHSLQRSAAFERMLVDEDVLLLKFWLHVTQEQQRERFERLDSDPDESWRVTKRDWKLHERYDELRANAEEVLRRTSTAEAPWHVVAAADGHWRDVAVSERLAAALEERLARPALPPPTPPAIPVIASANLLSTVDLGAALDPETYEREIDELQGRLGRRVRDLLNEERSAVIVFEGPDAAGKGGAIRRATRSMDPRFYRVHPISAPSDEERAQPWIWRFWRRLPRCGDVAIFDRSWYGRVLVERVEGFARPEEWKRAYREIVEFEEELAGARAVVVKLWLWIDADEQLRRFESRAREGYKRYKITEDDWRNRAKWPAYEAAACEMFERTSTSLAPWKLVAANDKRWARVECLRTIVAALS